MLESQGAWLLKAAWYYVFARIAWWLLVKLDKRTGRRGEAIINRLGKSFSSWTAPYWRKVATVLYRYWTRAVLYLEWLPLQAIAFFGWVAIDVYRRIKYGKPFTEFGITVYAGRQGQGKTISMVQYLRRMRKAYPRCKIVTNFACDVSDYIMQSWSEFFTIRNGKDGVIFALDEIQTEWSSLESKDFPAELLAEICQQRKQKVKIVTTSQLFGRMAKPLREQAFEVACCSTFLNRWTKVTAYDAWEYEQMMAQPLDMQQRLKSLWWRIYVQSDELRASYDTDEKVARLKDRKYIPRDTRPA